MNFRNRGHESGATQSEMELFIDDAYLQYLHHTNDDQYSPKQSGCLQVKLITQKLQSHSNWTAPQGQWPGVWGEGGGGTERVPDIGIHWTSK